MKEREREREREENQKKIYMKNKLLHFYCISTAFAYCTKVAQVRNELHFWYILHQLILFVGKLLPESNRVDGEHSCSSETWSMPKLA